MVRAFTLRAAPGEFVALVGPSGCGKTTTLAIAAGLDTAFDGRVERPERLGMVFQSPRLLPWRTVRQNVELVRPRAERGDGRADGLLAAMGLAAVAGHYPGQISLGMARRVALARAFAVDPDLLLMDEPFVSLDEATADRLRALLIERLAVRPATVLLVTHDLREAVSLADRILLLDAEPMRVRAEVRVDAPRDRRGPAFVEAFRRDLLDRGAAPA